MLKLFENSVRICAVALFAVLITAASAWAQVRTITGTVTNSSQETLIGASVFVKGNSTTGTVTDLNGLYTIRAESDDILVFSYVGYLTREVAVGDQNEINVILQVDRALLEEILVVGYGVQQRRDVTGSISSVSGNDIASIPVSSLDATLHGRAAGVFVRTPSGTPGAGISMQIRGTTSISGSSEPLYVVDGIPMISEDLSGLFSGGQATNSLADINPNDIASIEILKDASATAIYGSRGANGVVIITTKRGRSGQSNINMNYYRGAQSVANKIDMMSSREFLELMNDAARQDNIDLGTNYPENYVSDFWGYSDLSDPNLQNTRWYDEIFRVAPITNYELSAAGGAGNTVYYTSLSYLDQEGTQIGTGFERFSGRVNLDTDINKWLDIGTSMSVSRTVQDRTINDNSLYGVVINTLAADPLMPVYEDDGKYADPFDYFGWWMLDNPMLIAKEYFRETRTVRGLGSVYSVAKLLPGLNLRSSLSIDFTHLDDEAYTPSISRESRNGGFNGFGNYLTTQDFTWVAENYLSYNNTIAEKQTLNAVIGTSFQVSNRDFSSIRAQGYPNDQFIKTSVAGRVTSASTSGTSWALSSYFFRSNYTYDNRYLVTLTGRIDGSSRFGSDTRYGFFPSGSFAWRVSEESFMRNVSFISELKPRISYGITGNQDGIGNFAARGLFGVNDYRGIATLVPIQLNNPRLGWESTKQLDLGIDAGLLNDRILITADYFIKTTDNLLLSRLVPGISGFSNVIENIGSVENKGFEFTALGRILTGKLSWTSEFNISFIRNKILKLEVDNQILNDSHILAVGQPIGTFYLIDQDGVDPATGNIRWVDLNEDGVINSADRQIVGNIQPDFFGGWSNKLNYKNFDLSFLLQFTYGNDVFNHSRAFYEGLGWNRLSPTTGGGFPLPDGNNYRAANNRWQNPGDQTDIPRASLTNKNWREYSSRWLEDGSYLRLKNINMGYTLPSDIADRAGVKNMRIYVQGSNLLTFTGYKGFDPEVNQNARNPLVAGSDFGTLPQSRTIMFGINLSL
jgi:TonB-linked SusC/RagA family outer membrane protein